MKTRIVILALIAFSLTMWHPAEAINKLKKGEHRGFFIGGGLGYGNLAIDPRNDNPGRDRTRGGAGLVFVGGAVSPDLLLGLDVSVWTREEDNFQITFSNATLCLTYYFTPEFFVKGGPALTKVETELQQGWWGSEAHSESGFGATAGAGWEFRLGRKVALLPSAQWMYQSFDDFSSNFFSLTLSIGWFW